MIPSLNNQSYKSICDSKKINPDAVCLPSFFSSSDSDLELKEWSQSFKKDLPDWVPESVKNLFKETIFAENYNDVFSALKQDNKHILWPVGNHLLAWEKKDGKFSLTIICSQKKSMPPVAGKAFSIFSVLANLINKDSFSTQLSEWTDESKTRIDPIAVVYENLEESVFSEEWLSAIEENKVTPELFLPLQESQRKPQVLKFPDDKKGYLKRFKTNQRGDDTLWLYKTWMRHHLPIEDYKKFNFLNKYS